MTFLCILFACFLCGLVVAVVPARNLGQDLHAPAAARDAEVARAGTAGAYPTFHGANVWA